MRRVWSLVFTALLLAPVGPVAAEDGLTGPDREILKTLSQATTQGQLHFHSKPGEFTKEQVATAVEANHAEFTKLTKLLEMTYEGPIHIFLYRSVKDLIEKTKAAPGTVAYATGTRSIHQSIDFVSVHELTHIFALQFPTGEDTVPVEGFFVEGLATALAVHDQDVAIHDWAAAYATVDRVPELTAFRRAWPKGHAPGVHPYHVAGSFVGYLVERFGIEKTKRLYMNCLECGQILGRSFALLESDWRDWLAKRKVSEKARDHVYGRLGISKRRIPDALTDGAWKRLFDGKSLKGWSRSARTPSRPRTASSSARTTRTGRTSTRRRPTGTPSRCGPASHSGRATRSRSA